MKKLIISLLLLTLISCTAQKNIEVSQQKLTESERLDAMETQMRQYGKQNLTADQIMLLQVGVVTVGAIASVPAVPLLIITSACNLINVLLSKKADKKLSKYNSK